MHVDTHKFTQIWDVVKGVQVAQLHTGSDYWMIDMTFSPDGKKVVTLCDSIQVHTLNPQHFHCVNLVVELQLLLQN